MEKLQQAVLRTLSYADVFDYPLKPQEVWQYLIGQKVQSPEMRQKALWQTSEVLKLVKAKKEYVFLNGREKLVELREKREKWSRKKLRLAKKLVERLKLIPWVKMVGVSGSLAIANSPETDDIDILIVCSEDRLWLTRLASVLLLEALGKRRRPDDREVRDKICLNMFLDKAHLSVPEKERDLFSAHEVCQLKILWDKEGIAENFFRENRWIKKYLPNSLNLTFENKHVKPEKLFGPEYLVFGLLESVVKKLQLWYMRNRRTTEVISEGVIRFHPQDARGWVLREYGLRLRKLGLDKI